VNLYNGIKKIVIAIYFSKDKLINNHLKVYNRKKIKKCKQKKPNKPRINLKIKLLPRKLIKRKFNRKINNRRKRKILKLRKLNRKLNESKIALITYN